MNKIEMQAIRSFPFIFTTAGPSRRLIIKYQQPAIPQAVRKKQTHNSQYFIKPR